MPKSISFAGPTPAIPNQNQAQKGNVRQFTAAPATNAKDSIHFSEGPTQKDIATQTPDEVDEAPKTDNWFSKRCQTIMPALKTSYHGGDWFSLPFKGWKADLLQASIVLVPISPFLAGAQLPLIPVWMGVGALARTGWALSKGMWNPDKVLQKVADQKKAEEAAKAKNQSR